MSIQTLVQKVGGALGFKKKAGEVVAPVLTEPARFPYGPFRFKARTSKGIAYSILASSDLMHWSLIGQGIAPGEELEYVDSDAAKFGYRFYRLLAADLPSVNVIGYASVALPPGFSLIANPFDGHDNTVGTTFTGWPDGTTINKYDTRQIQLNENAVKNGKWTNPQERLLRGEGAMFFNPTEDYKSHSFVGEVVQGNLTMPVPAGFSLRSSLVPKAGNLSEDLGFPISDGDVVHMFDRDRQKYVLHPFENGKWPAGAPILSVGESFWVAKTEPGNWTRNLQVSG
jgi:hypothetical protein